jgi:hypothetical protein
MLLTLLYDGFDSPHDLRQELHVSRVGGMDFIHKCAPLLG